MGAIARAVDPRVCMAKNDIAVANPFRLSRPHPELVYAAFDPSVNGEADPAAHLRRPRDTIGL